MSTFLKIMAASCLLAPTLVSGQNTDLEKSPKKESKVQVKIFQEEDGVSTSFDTSFNNLEDAKAAMKHFYRKSNQTAQEKNDHQMLEFCFPKTPIEEDDTRENRSRRKKRVMVFGPHGNSEEMTEALKSLEQIQFEMPEFSALPEMKIFQHDWAMNGSSNFSLNISDATKDELNKLGVKPSNADDYIEDLAVSGLSSKNKLRLYFEVLEQTNLTVKIYSQDGKEIYAQSHARYLGSFNNVIDLGRRIKGTVFLVVTANGRNIIKKISRGNVSDN